MKKPVPKIINWPPCPTMGSGRLGGIRDPNKIAEMLHMGISNLFTDYEEFFRTATMAIPDHEVPLFVSRDLPDFVVDLIEQRIKKGANHEPDSN